MNMLRIGSTYESNSRLIRGAKPNLFAANRRSRLLLAAVLVCCAFECLPVIGQEYGGNLTPPPPRPRRAYSTGDSYNYTHGGGDTAYSDSYKKARKIKKVKKLKQSILKSKSDDTTSKVTTGGSGSGGTSSESESEPSKKSDVGSSARSTPYKVESSKKTKSSGADLTDSSADSDKSETKASSTDSNSSATSDAKTSESKVSEIKATEDKTTESKASESKTSKSASSSSVRTGGARLSSIPPPQMPPPPLSTGGFLMKSDSAR